MATSSKKGVSTRLGIKPGHTVYSINIPAESAGMIGSLPSGSRIVEEEELPADRVIVFIHEKTELQRQLPRAIRATKPDGALWVAYPKIDAKRSDLSRQAVHDALCLAGWKPVGVISIDDVWTAIRARPSLPGERPR